MGGKMEEATLKEIVEAQMRILESLAESVELLNRRLEKLEATILK